MDSQSFWHTAKSGKQIVGLDIDNEEFASLFTASVGKTAAAKKDSSDAKKPTNKAKQKVQLIDGRRRMNGSILLAKFKVDYKELAKKIDKMESIEAEANEIRGMMQLLPTKDESLALRSYLPPADAPQADMDDAISKLGECEQYMAIMLDVPDAKNKFQSMLYRAEFESHFETIRDGINMLSGACDSIRDSDRLSKLLVYALKLGNALNTGGSGKEVAAITLDSLLKLREAKAFDRETSVLHYLVSIVQKNDEDVLKLSDDLLPVKAAQRVAVDMLSQQLTEMSNGVKLVGEVAKNNTPVDDTTGTPEDELMAMTAMGEFFLDASAKIRSLSFELIAAKNKFSELLVYFGEDNSMNPDTFFSTLNSFVAMFDETLDELKRKEEAKARKKRIEEKRKVREQAQKQKT